MLAAVVERHLAAFQDGQLQLLFGAQTSGFTDDVFVGETTRAALRYLGCEEKPR